MRPTKVEKEVKLSFPQSQIQTLANNLPKLSDNL